MSRANKIAGLFTPLNESLQQDIQKAVDTISKEHKIQSVTIKFVTRALRGGDAFYQTSHKKGTRDYTPLNITIGDWAWIKDHPDEWLFRLAHEVAHHILAQTQSTLRHSGKHLKLADQIENKLRHLVKPKKKLSPLELQRVRDKLNYWTGDGKKDMLAHHGKKVYADEVRTMKKKIMVNK